jgi:TRAP-type mannitol/chloroaromatic compound transport system permease small subunit
MLHTLESIASFFDRINDWTGRLVAWLTLFMVLVTFTVVVLRYGFNMGWIAMQESVIYMHSLVFLLGAAYTLKNQGHVRVDIVYRAVSPMRRVWIDLIGTAIFLLPMFAFILYSSWDYIGAAWEVRETSREAGGLPWVYLLKSSLIVMGVLIMMQGLADMVRCAMVIAGLRDYELMYGKQEGGPSA